MNYLTPWHGYDHKAEKGVENEEVKILWDFKCNIYTGKQIEARRLDIIMIKNKLKECTIIDIAVPEIETTLAKVDEKVEEKYQELSQEISRPWKMRTTVVQIIVALGTTAD